MNVGAGAVDGHGLQAVEPEFGGAFELRRASRLVRIPGCTLEGVIRTDHRPDPNRRLTLG